MNRFVPPAIQFFVHALKEQLVRTDGEACDSAAPRESYNKFVNRRDTLSVSIALFFYSDTTR